MVELEREISALVTEYSGYVRTLKKKVGRQQLRLLTALVVTARAVTTTLLLNEP